IPEVDRKRRLRRPRDADEHDVRVVQPPADTVVVLDRELDRGDAAEVVRIERRAGAGSHLRHLPGDLRHRVDRLAQDVAVVDLRATAQLVPWVAGVRLGQGGGGYRRPSLSPVDGETKVVL